jgi:hypothetical protein
MSLSAVGLQRCCGRGFQASKKLLLPRAHLTQHLEEWTHSSS